MPRRTIISTLPPRLRTQLHKRLLASAFGDTVKIAAWLTARGHPIRHSAVASYAKAHRAQIERASRQAAPTAARLLALRAQCLQAAARVGSEAVLERAEAYVAWVLGREA